MYTKENSSIVTTVANILQTTVVYTNMLTLTLPAGAIFGPIQSKIDAADNSYCQETSLTGIRPIK